MRTVNEPTLTSIGAPTPERVRALECVLLRMPQVDLSTTHLLYGGMYVRTILIPAGTVLTGAEMEVDNICIVDGDIEVTTDTGVRRLIGRHVLASPRGLKRAGVALADTYWTTIVATDATDVEQAEDEATHESHLLQTRSDMLARSRAEEIEG